MLKLISQLVYLLGEERKKIPFLILLFLLASGLDLLGLSLIGPYVAMVVNPEYAENSWLERLTEFGLPQESQAMIAVFGLILFSVFALKTVVAIGIHWVIVNFSEAQQLRLRTDLMEAYQGLPYVDYLRRNSSEYIYSIQILAGRFADIVRTILRIVCDSIIATVIIALLASTNVSALLLLVIILGFVVATYDRVFRRYMVEYGRQYNRANTRLVQSTQEGISGFQEIRILGCEKYFLEMVKNNAQDIKYYHSRQLLAQQAPWYLFEWVMVSFMVLLVIGAPFLGTEVQSLLPTLGVFAVAGLRLVSLANTLATGLVQLRFSRDHLSRLFQDLRQLKQLKIREFRRESRSFDDLPIDCMTNENNEQFRLLEISDLCYRYPNEQFDVLKGIRLEIHVGESVGIIGRSGAGKTTLINLLLGLLEPDTDCIRLNGRPLRSALKEWYAQVAYLPQEVFLIDDTLRRNVALGVANEAVNNARLDEALSRARLDGVVQRLPQGVETRLGEHGARLSGGQRQRVALARAFYHGRKVLVMDESTSALDNETEKEIIEEIKLLKGNVTLIVIAHRLTTVEHCDRIIQLENGRIVSQGRPEDVLAGLQ